MNKRRKIIVPKIVRGGSAIPLGNNFYYMKGRTHEQGGIDIGENPRTGIEVEGEEVVEISPNQMRVFSSVPFLYGQSPAKLVMAGVNPNEVFNAQERFKDINKLNDDGTRQKRGGGLKKIIRRAIDKEARNATVYDSDNYSFQEAYADARRKGDKTFFWNNEYYNTDYYGIHHRNYDNDLASRKVEEFERQNPGISYPELVAAKQEELDTYGITNEFTRNKNRFDRNIINNLVPANYRNELPRAFKTGVLGIPEQGSVGQSSGMSFEDRQNANGSLAPELDDLWLLMGGYPIRYNTIKISDYAPTIGRERDYYFTTDSFRRALELEQDKDNLEVGQNQSVQIIAPLFGESTIGKGKDYISHYDIFDVNYHFNPNKRYGNNIGLYQLGNGVPLYDRLYDTKTQNNINRYRNGGRIKKQVGGENKYPRQLEDINLYTTRDMFGDVTDRRTMNDIIYDYAIAHPVSINTSTESPAPSPTSSSTPISTTPPPSIDEEFDYTNLLLNSVGSLANIVGNAVSHPINAAMLKDLEYYPVPIPITPTKLKTRINITPQIQRLYTNLGEMEEINNANTASSRTAIGRNQRLRNQVTQMANELYAAKENAETELINKDRLNAQAIDAQNIAQYNAWRQGKTDFNNKIRELRSENDIALTQGIADAISDLATSLNLTNAEATQLAYLHQANPFAAEALTPAALQALKEQYGFTSLFGNKTKGKRTRTKKR